MARAGFYNENEYRDYPFLTQVEPREIVAVVEAPSSSSSSLSSASSAAAQPLLDLPHETIVDFGAIMAVDSGFRTNEDFIWLHRIRRQDPYLLFEFRTTAKYARNEALFFLRRIDDPEFTHEWAESISLLLPDPFPTSSSSSLSSSISSSLSSASLSSLSSNPFCNAGMDGDTKLLCGGPGCDAPKWEGFLITGLFSELLDTLATGEQIVFVQGVWVIEPARIQNLNNTFARSFNLANRDRTHVTPPEHCSSVSANDGTIFANAVCLQGDLRFKEGYNCNIRQENQNNTIVISGAVGGGEGDPCEEIPLYDGEVPPFDSPFLSGGPACGEIIRTISGKGGPAVRIFGGSGVRVYDAPANPSAIFIDADLSDFALCLQTEPGPGDPCYVAPSSSSLSSAGGP